MIYLAVSLPVVYAASRRQIRACGAWRRANETWREAQIRAEDLSSTLRDSGSWEDTFRSAASTVGVGNGSVGLCPCQSCSAAIKHPCVSPCQACVRVAVHKTLLFGSEKGKLARKCYWLGTMEVFCFFFSRTAHVFSSPQLAAPFISFLSVNPAGP